MDIVITKADKGNVVVVMDMPFYLDRMSTLLSNPVYKPIQEDPTKNLHKTLKRLISEFAQETGDETLTKISKRLGHPSRYQCPEMYCLPKIHKVDIPFRPVVSSINSILSELSSYLKRLIQPLVGKQRSAVKNSKTFREELKRMNIGSTDIMVSYDVKDLFTNVPIPDTLQVLMELLSSDVTLPQRTKLNPFHIVKLCSFCMLEGNIFHFRGSFYKQENGVPMGSPLSPVLAEVFVEHFERQVFFHTSTEIAPAYFKRYVDDIFAILKRGTENNFLDILNRECPNVIAFTIEKELDGKLPFLDILIIRSEEGIKTTVYRKPTHSDKYIEFTSHHPRHVMIGILHGMVNRALPICDQEYLEEKLEHIRRTFKHNGYPVRLINSVIRRTLEGRTRETRPTAGPRLILPYYAGSGEKIKRLGNRLGFKVWFKGNKHLRSILRNDKEKVPPDRCPGVVYAITCACSASYIGETGNTLAHRYQERRKSLTWYRNAANRLNGEPSRTHRGRPPTLDPRAAMEQATQTSAVPQHAAE
ncbi:hypothetical protein M514_11958 [Trichuris suis]|nr:hypothetical protein M514_11958 [Trichuris suis]